MLRLTGGRGVDRVVEVGGGSSLEKSLKALVLGGEIAFVGALSGGSPMINAYAIFQKGAIVRTVAVGSRAQLAEMMRAMSVHQLRPGIDRVFSFDETPQAFAYYAEGQAFGKVVIRVGEGAKP